MKWKLVPDNWGCAGKALMLSDDNGKYIVTFLGNTRPEWYIGTLRKHGATDDQIVDIAAEWMPEIVFGFLEKSRG